MKLVTRAVLVRFLGERGATGVEYGLMIALIAMAMFGTLYVLGPNLDAAFDDVVDRLSTPAPPPPPAPEPPAPSTVYYEDCDAVRAAGADPIRVGDPGYRLELDPDGDGVGCL
ncbi:MAG: calcium-binding protein [Ornithinibacter sp.]|jgi:Flp pilus assembly pilin Flp|nr:calcium-binding protein [Ornithinibacter sp.]